MDIRKLVNNGQARQQDIAMNPRDWPAHAHQTLPPFSSVFPEPSHQAGYHYPIPPHGEGYNGYAQYQAYQHQYQQPQPTSLPPQYTPYMTNAPSRSSSSTVSVSSTKYAPSASSGPATSAERRSLSDEDDDDVDTDSEAHSHNSTSPLPQYAPSSQAFMDTGSPDAEHVCDDCGVSYSRAPDLRRHKASVHNDRDSREKVAATFPCEVCGQVLLSSHGYQGHMRRHYDERPFVCEAPFCGKAFHDSATLARHRRTHSTEHKFECDFCGRRFKRKDNLNTHRKKHQVGGETINPNLLRKPVTRVAGDSPPQATPTYSELPLASPTYQLAPQPAYDVTPQPSSYAPMPQYTTQPPQYYQPAPSYQQFQRPGAFMVKEEPMPEMNYRMTRIPQPGR